MLTPYVQINLPIHLHTIFKQLYCLSALFWIDYLCLSMELFIRLNMVLLEESSLHSSTYLHFMTPDIKFYQRLIMFFEL